MSQSPNLPRTSHTYKVVDGLELQLDAIASTPEASRPCALWIHGGGLIFGSRTVSPRESLLRALVANGLAVVSIDHRLAPEAKLPAIVEDVQDAWRWLHEVGPSALGVDPGRTAITGASAGGYLSLMAGHLFEPRPRAVASFFGFGDITAPWEADPSPFYRGMELVNRETALSLLTAPPVQDPALGPDRSAFYLYCRQQGQWLEEVTGHDPRQEPAWFDPYCPLRNITPAYPPSIIVHGTEDNDVPHQESANLAGKLAAHGVEHEFISLPGVGHGFAGAPAEEVARVEAAVANFLRTHLI